MSKAEDQLYELIRDSDPEWKNKMWQRLVREHLGCEFCQNYNKQEKACSLGHKDTLEQRNGIPCDDMLPNSLN